MDEGRGRGRDRVGDVEEILNRQMAVVVNYIAYFRGKWVWCIGQTGIEISIGQIGDGQTVNHTLKQDLSLKHW